MELTGRTVLSSRLVPGIEIGALQKGFYQQNGLILMKREIYSKIVFKMNQLSLFYLLQELKDKTNFWTR